MSGFTAPIRRVDSVRRGKPTHWYADAANRRIPGVTTLLGDGLPKPALINWAANTTAEYAVDHWDALSDETPSRKLEILKKARYEVSDAAKNCGTEVHALAERLVNGEQIDVPEPLTGHVDAYCRFLDEWEPQPLLVEVVVYHLAHGWAGTLDLIARLADERTWLLDIKTSKRVYADTAYQLAAYAHAQAYLDAHGQPQPLPHIDAVGVVHVRSDGYDLVPLDAGAATYKLFRHIATVARAGKTADGLVGQTLTPPQAKESAA